MATLQDLEAAITETEEAVKENRTVDGSAGVLLIRLNQLYKDALASGGTPDAVLERVRQLNTLLIDSNKNLAEAVAVNTPAEPSA